MTTVGLAQEVKTRPIIFGAESVRAILEGRKTQTRRALTPQPPDGARVAQSTFDARAWHWCLPSENPTGPSIFDPKMACPYGRRGDRLWVREAFCAVRDIAPGQTSDEGVTADNFGIVAYRESTRPNREGFTIGSQAYRWRTPIYMPRWASRITLELTEVRVERLQDINTERHDEVLKEGWPFEPEDLTRAENPVSAFRRGWDRLNKARGFGWDANPFVWVLSFKRVTD